MLGLGPVEEAGAATQADTVPGSPTAMVCATQGRGSGSPWGLQARACCHPACLKPKLVILLYTNHHKHTLEQELGMLSPKLKSSDKPVSVWL